ncbi:TIGR03899 family protein [Pseudoalteromonas sp. MEBiC 03485]|uniref:TIGR03899 family protein n=1 Tax=Pseudoalteromonas sp. MEBiC 03485 TaxID=2571103 RepID=UPI001020EB31|nr:TIGR03899 family protein [Pseudoalteromonas sp. MEBiC 03485]QLE08238.1 TIGR03899 family protein [Pseudoalteromonas shioyasakiensis]RZD20940.1 TIGR03899 family protein [Pseudoalteromonas sp. MEBiC 03485]
MTVKAAQARVNLANIIENQLGYPIHKAPSARINHADNDSYSAQGQQQLAYQIRAQASLLERAQTRQEIQFIKRQENIETIMSMAMAFCPDVTGQQQPDFDWIERFISLCEDTANSSMQKLWAKILAGETVSPGTFSIKSLQTLKHMTQREADALQRCTSLCGFNEKDNSHLILLGFYKKPSLFDLLRKGNKVSFNLGKTPVSFPDILTLMDINLLYRKEIESAVLKAGQELVLSFMNQRLVLIAKSNDLVLSYYKFTQTGDELRKLIASPINKAYKQILSTALEDEFEVSWQALK